jgi:hypothetical protein
MQVSTSLDMCVPESVCIMRLLMKIMNNDGLLYTLRLPIKMMVLTRPQRIY